MKVRSPLFYFLSAGFVIVLISLSACGSKNPVKPPPLLDLPDQLNTDVLVPLTVCSPSMQNNSQYTLIIPPGFRAR